MHRLRMRVVTVLTVTLLLGAQLTSGTNFARAHANFDHAEPGPGAMLNAAPALVTIWFSEELQPEQSWIHVLTSDGARVDLDDSALLPDSETALAVDLQPGLPPGTYTVSWQNLSQDGDGLAGSYQFMVGGGATISMTVNVGGMEPMLMEDQAAGATEGEIMPSMAGMEMPMMTMMDQGHPVNHHLEAHLYNAATGEPIMDQVPTISVRNQATGEEHMVADVVPMYGAEEGLSDWHYGNNVYLPDGLYTITVSVGGQTSVFPDVSVMGGEEMEMPGMNDMPGMDDSPDMNEMPGMSN